MATTRLRAEDRIEKAFRDIDSAFYRLAQENKEELDAALIRPIHEQYPFAQNGICAMIASMGSGKSYNYLKAIAKQEVLDPKQPFYELVVICSTSAKFDRTVETYKQLIRKSKLVCVKDSDLLFWLNKYMRRILKYNGIVNYVNSKCKEPNEEMQRLFEKHRLAKQDKQIKYITEKLVKYNWSTYPHRCLLVLDDFANHPLLRSKETEMCRLLKKLRHFNINVIICVQTVKSIPKDIKRTLSDIILFPGIGEDDFMELMKESPAGMFDKKKLWEAYKQVTDPQAMFSIYIKARKIIVTLPLVNERSSSKGSYNVSHSQRGQPPLVGGS